MSVVLAIALVLSAQSPALERTALDGTASWYRTPGLTAAAGPALRHALGRDWRGQLVKVCARNCVTVRLTDWCQCYGGERRERLLDLADAAFARIAPLAAGLVRVTVSPIVPPATDIEGPR